MRYVGLRSLGDLQWPAPSVLRDKPGGSQAALSYLRDMADSTKGKRMDTALLSFVGDTGAGKTSLWLSLAAGSGGEQRAEPAPASTDGVEFGKARPAPRPPHFCMCLGLASTLPHSYPHMAAVAHGSAAVQALAC